MKNLAKVTRSLSRENSRGESTPDGTKPSFKSGSAKIMKLRNATRAMSSESSDSPERNQSRKVSFKSHSDKVRTLSAVREAARGQVRMELKAAPAVLTFRPQESERAVKPINPREKMTTPVVPKNSDMKSPSWLMEKLSVFPS